MAICICSPIPIVNIEWVDDGSGFVQFYTNDPAKASQRFVKLYMKPLKAYGIVRLLYGHFNTTKGDKLEE